MARKKATAKEIQQEILKRIQESSDLDGDCRGCGAPTPRRANPAQNHGCNWDVDILPKLIPGCRDFVQKIIAQVKSEYDLL